MKEIKLTQGQTALVDDDDFERLSAHKWQAVYKPGYANGGVFVAVRSVQINRQQRAVYMHREIMAAPTGTEVDHIDRNPLNNQKANLRFATRAQNNRNQGLRRNNSSGYKGVYYRARYDNFTAGVRFNGQYFYLGLFATAEEAARARDAKTKEVHGDFAVLNFPD